MAVHSLIAAGTISSKILMQINTYLLIVYICYLYNGNDKRSFTRKVETIIETSIQNPCVHKINQLYSSWEFRQYLASKPCVFNWLVFLNLLIQRSGSPIHVQKFDYMSTWTSLMLLFFNCSTTLQTTHVITAGVYSDTIVHNDN
jgi:hypothetical protein